MPQQILNFWFDELQPKQWWAVDEAVDKEITQRFQSHLIKAAAGELYTWRETPKGRLAEIIVLDQFSRNCYRNTPAAFAQDPMALALAQEAVALGVTKQLNQTECSFLLMPFMHSESKLIHIQAEKLFKECGSSNNYAFELKHKAIVDRFGRYPHRNKILARESTQEELAFLEQPGSSF